MAEQVNLMTTGKPIKLIFRFSVPLMIGNVCQQLYTVVDSIIVSHGVGLNGLASLGASDWYYWLFLWTIMGTTQGFSVLVAQHFGAKRYAELRNTIYSIIILCAIFAVVVTVISEAALLPVLKLLNTPASVLPGSVLFLRILFGGNAIVIAFNMTAAILRALGNSRLPFITMVIASAVNVGLDIMLILVLKLGIAGAGIATTVAQLIAFLICFHGLRKIDLLKFHKEDKKLHGPTVRHLCYLGIPLGLQNGIIAVGGLVVQDVLNTFGMAFIAGFTATNKLNGIVESIAGAFGFGLSTYMGHNYGAGNVKRIEEGMKAVLLLALIFSVTIATFMIIFRTQILSLFIAASDKSADEALAIASHYLLIMSSGLFILFLVHLYRNALQGIGNVVGPVLSGVAELIMRSGVALLLPLLIGQEGIFFCEPAAWVGADAVLITTYYIVMHKFKKQHEQSEL